MTRWTLQSWPSPLVGLAGFQCRSALELQVCAGLIILCGDGTPCFQWRCIYFDFRFHTCSLFKVRLCFRQGLSSREKTHFSYLFIYFQGQTAFKVLWSTGTVLRNTIKPISHLLFTSQIILTRHFQPQNGKIDSELILAV